MSIKTEFILEMRKLRRRHIPLLFLMIFALITAWTCWCMDDLDITRLNDASAMLFTNLLLMNTILCPIILAALASRMCDMEQMGNTYKWICTMQTLLFWAVSRSYGGGAASHLTGYFTTICLTSLCIFILQLNLSLKFTNQLTPIFISIGGTFTGLFSWF
ncbi:ABC transporter permease [Enterocloster clostridioformis]|nr:ABC transporter permease [Enterocloster clostridioformis]